MSDLKPLSAEELDEIAAEGFSHGKGQLPRLISMARASLAPKGWPSRDTFSDAMYTENQGFIGTSDFYDGARWAYQYLTRHAPPQGGE